MGVNLFNPPISERLGFLCLSRQFVSLLISVCSLSAVVLHRHDTTRMVLKIKAMLAMDLQLDRSGSEMRLTFPRIQTPIKYSLNFIHQQICEIHHFPEMSIQNRNFRIRVPSSKTLPNYHPPNPSDQKAKTYLNSNYLRKHHLRSIEYEVRRATSQPSKVIVSTVRNQYFNIGFEPVNVLRQVREWASIPFESIRMSGWKSAVLIKFLIIPSRGWRQRHRPQTNRNKTCSVCTKFSHQDILLGF